MKKHVIKICQTAYFELKCISSIRRFLTEDAAKTCYFLYPLTAVTTATVSSWVHLIQPLQKIQNFATRLVLLAPRHHHSTRLLEKLLWLPISERIKYKVACKCLLYMVLVLLTSLNCCMSTLRLVHYALLLTPAC